MIWALFAACEPQPFVAATYDMKVLTYNVHGLPPEITGDDTAARMRQIGPLLNGNHIVGVQEDWVDENHAILDGGVDYETRDRETNKLDNRAYGKGLAMFSVLDAVGTAGDFYDTCFGTIESASDCFASKGWRMLSLDVTPVGAPRKH